MKSKSTGMLLLLGTLVMPLAPALAQQPAPPAAAAAADFADAEVRKVDAGQGRLTLKHGEIKSLDMPPMTMVFRVQDKALLDKLKPGDRIRFKAVDDGGKLTVTEVMPVR